MGNPDNFPTIDPAALPDHFDGESARTRLTAFWEKTGVYRYDARRPRNETFVVDTPPPTVSGALHIGHVFSYTHADIIVRHRRMRGMNVFYPMGWDDNGLPTERRVQNYFHIRCDPSLPYDPALKVTHQDKPHGPALKVSRKNFIELCRMVTEADERAFRDLWQADGLSVDWNEVYATIGDSSRRAAQESFLDLFAKGHVYNREEPVMWDTDFHTAVAQAEVEDRPLSSHFHRIEFGVEGGGSFIVATTRPELLPACVGVAAHPEDPRYRGLIGKRAITPLFRVPVPIFASDMVDREKGTGILMVCTFGDSTDLQWWRERKLPLRRIIGMDGRLLPMDFSAAGSLGAADAGEAYDRIKGKSVGEARKEIVGLLQEAAHLKGEPEPITHMVNFYEKGDHPLEFVTTRQWFVRLLDKKDMLIAQGNKIQWHPDHMRLRYLNWTENLQFDWCISRQRYFGVAFPVWYPLDADRRPDHDRPILAEPSRLPVDPMSDVPAGYTEPQRGAPGGFIGEPDVFDTWFTSSLTPQILSGWKTDEERHGKLFPMDLRPQAHEIIRTWAFYTIAKSALHESSIPWSHIALSGWILDPDRKKMSKSRGNVVTPMEYLERYTPDGVRYWAGMARLGTDTAFDEKMLKIGKRLVTKIYNASKFVLSQGARRGPVTEEIDRAFCADLAACAGRAGRAFDEMEFARALMETEGFFWGSFTDAYIELVKTRAKKGSDEDPGRISAAAGLRLGLCVLLRLFAPFLPYVTEEAWQWVFAAETGWPSIHRAPWPGKADFKDMPVPEDQKSFQAASACLQAIHRLKTQSGASVGVPLTRVTIKANSATLAVLARSIRDVMSAARAEKWDFREAGEMQDMEMSVVETEIASTE